MPRTISGLNRQVDPARYLLRIRHELAPTIGWAGHDVQLPRAPAGRIFVLHYEKELATGSADAVLSNPKVIEAYIGGRWTPAIRQRREAPLCLPFCSMGLQFRVRFVKRPKGGSRRLARITI
ncbi:MAG: hypothetical protein K9G60_03710 [Pseudolabrys sp.]|nr:hypothetical protein [Pseudolabrys sp.]